MKKRFKGWIALALATAVGAGTPLCGSARASVVWQANPNNGTKDFHTIDNVNGYVKVVADSTQAYGKVWQIVCNDNGNTKAREEISGMGDGFTPPSNSAVYYFGWKQKWGPLPTKVGKWQVLEQVHQEGPAAGSVPVPFGIQVPGDGMMHFQYEPPTGGQVYWWSHSLPLNQWHSFVFHVQFATNPTTGYVEFWYDGKMQTLINGKTRYPSQWAYNNTYWYWKWGIYRSGAGGPIGTSYAYLAHPRTGTTYADVVP